jgi:hypothetical protein
MTDQELFDKRPVRTQMCNCCRGRGTVVTHYALGPSERFAGAPDDAVVEIIRALTGGGRYELSRDGESVRIYVSENVEHDAAVSLNAVEVTRLRSDLLTIAARSER